MAKELEELTGSLGGEDMWTGVLHCALEAARAKSCADLDELQQQGLTSQRSIHLMVQHTWGHGQLTQRQAQFRGPGSLVQQDLAKSVIVPVRFD